MKRAKSSLNVLVGVKKKALVREVTIPSSQFHIRSGCRQLSASWVPVSADVVLTMRSQHIRKHGGETGCTLWDA